MESIENVAIIIPSLNPDEKLMKVVSGLIEAGYKKIVLVNDGSNSEHEAPFEEAKKHKESMEKMIPCGRFGTPEEVANIALFFASKEASYVNGSIYNVDGGAGAA